MTPNTDSRELNLSDILNDIENYKYGKHDVTLRFIETAILAYTANKQKELLDWVEQEVVGADEKAERVRYEYGYAPEEHATERNDFRAAQRNQLKNKRKEL